MSPTTGNEMDKVKKVGYYEEETRALSAILLSLFTARNEIAFGELERSLQKLAFPPAVRRLCEEALQSHSEDDTDRTNARAVCCLLHALESISGYKHVERYISQRNQAVVYC